MSAIIADISHNKYTAAPLHEITLPTDSVAGSHLLVGITEDATTDVLSVFEHIVTSDDVTAGYFGYSPSASNAITFVAIRFTNGNSVEISSLSNGTSDSPNSPNLVSSGGTEENVFLSIVGWDGNVAHSSYSTNYNNNQTTDRLVDTSEGVGIAVCTRNLTASSDDPGVQTLASSVPWGAFTVVIRPALVIIPPTTTLILSGLIPTVTAEADVVVTPPVKALTLTTFPPLVSIPQVVTPPVASLVITPQPPTISSTQHQRVIPSTIALLLSTFEPDVTSSSSLVVVPPTLSLLTARYPPTISAGENLFVIIPKLSLLTSPFIPSIYAGSTVVVPKLSLLSSSLIPSISLSSNILVTVPILSSILSFFPPEGTGGHDDTRITPPTASLSLSSFIPEIFIRYAARWWFGPPEDCTCCDECIENPTCDATESWYCCCWDPITKTVQQLPAYRISIRGVLQGPDCGSNCEDFFNVDIDMECGDEDFIEEVVGSCVKTLSWRYKPNLGLLNFDIGVTLNILSFNGGVPIRINYSEDWFFPLINMPKYNCSDPDNPLASETYGERIECVDPTIGISSPQCFAGASIFDCSLIADITGCDLRNIEFELIRL